MQLEYSKFWSIYAHGTVFLTAQMFFAAKQEEFDGEQWPHSEAICLIHPML